MFTRKKSSSRIGKEENFGCVNSTRTFNVRRTDSWSRKILNNIDEEGVVAVDYDEHDKKQESFFDCALPEANDEFLFGATEELSPPKSAYTTNTRASSRVMEISSGLERNRSTSMMGSLYSSKTRIFLDKAQKLRDTTERQQPVVIRPIRPIRPNRVQMAPMKRPPAVMADEDDDEDEEERERETPSHKKGKLEDNAIDSILNKIYR